MRLAIVLVLACVVGAYRGSPACCKIMGSLDCIACSNGVPLANADIRDLTPDARKLHLPTANKKRFFSSPKILRPRPHIITSEADDVTNGAPIACPQGSPNCYRPPQADEGCDHDGVTFENELRIPGASPCLRPGQNAGPIMRPGGKYAPMYPAPYGLPHYPFPPDTQDWTRPALVDARNEGEVTEEEGEQLEKEELPDKDGVDSR